MSFEICSRSNDDIEDINYTDEEFHEVLKNLIFELEKENVSLQEVRRQYYIYMLSLVGIRVTKEYCDNQAYYVAYFNKHSVKKRVSCLKAWLNNFLG